MPQTYGISEVPMTLGGSGDAVLWRNWVSTNVGSTTTNLIPNVDISMTTATASNAYDHIWKVWTNDTSTIATTASGTNGVVWSNWVNPHIPIQSIRPQGAPISSWRETPEMVAERGRREADAAKLRAAEDRKRVLAEERATQLLVSVLSEEQRRDFSKHGHFFVDAPSSGRLYRIDKARSGNVKVIDRVTGNWTESLCIHQRDNVPVPDTMLMQKLLIETAEDEFRAVANITKKDGGYGYGSGLLDGERLARVLPFRSRDGQLIEATA